MNFPRKETTTNSASNVSRRTRNNTNFTGDQTESAIRVPSSSAKRGQRAKKTASRTAARRRSQTLHSRPKSRSRANVESPMIAADSIQQSDTMADKSDQSDQWPLKAIGTCCFCEYPVNSGRENNSSLGARCSVCAIKAFHFDCMGIDQHIYRRMQVKPHCSSCSVKFELTRPGELSNGFGSVNIKIQKLTDQCAEHNKTLLAYKEHISNLEKVVAKLESFKLDRFLAARFQRALPETSLQSASESLAPATPVIPNGYLESPVVAQPRKRTTIEEAGDLSFEVVDETEVSRGDSSMVNKDLLSSDLVVKLLTNPPVEKVVTKPPVQPKGGDYFLCDLGEDIEKWHLNRRKFREDGYRWVYKKACRPAKWRHFTFTVSTCHIDHPDDPFKKGSKGFSRREYYSLQGNCGRYVLMHYSGDHRLFIPFPPRYEKSWNQSFTAQNAESISSVNSFEQAHQDADNVSELCNAQSDDAINVNNNFHDGNSEEVTVDLVNAPQQSQDHSLCSLSTNADAEIFQNAETEFGDFACPICEDLCLGTLANYITHCGVIHADCEYKCPACEFVSASCGNFQRHYFYKHSSSVLPKHICIECNRRFPNPAMLEKHMLMHKDIQSVNNQSSSVNGVQAVSNGDVFFSCSHCSLTFKKISQYTSHAKEIHPQMFKCPACEYKSQRAGHFQRHYWSQHNPDDTPFVCNHCQKQFLEKWALNRHLQNVHADKKKNFSSPAIQLRLRRQREREQEEQDKAPGSYECPVCEKNFLSMIRYQKHYKSTHIKKKHQCERCVKTFLTTGHKNRHMRTVHLKMIVKNHKCQFCGMLFNLPSKKRLHIMKIHTNERPYKCTECSCTYVERHELTKHLLLHKVRRPFKCRHCDKTYTAARMRDNHEITEHTLQFRLHCDICRKGFCERDEIRQHFEKEHPDHV